MFANAFFGGLIGAIVGVLLIAVLACFVAGDED